MSSMDTTNSPPPFYFTEPVEGDEIRDTSQPSFEAHNHLPNESLENEQTSTTRNDVSINGHRFPPDSRYDVLHSRRSSKRSQRSSERDSRHYSSRHRDEDRYSRTRTSRSYRHNSPDSEEKIRSTSQHKRSSSRNRKRHRHRSTSRETSDEKKHKRRHNSRSPPARASKWDTKTQDTPDEAPPKRYIGGFSSAPPPPIEPHPTMPGTISTGVDHASLDAAQLIPKPTLKVPTAAELEGDRKQRRLYIGNLPPGSSQEDVIGFFNGALLSVAAATDTPLVNETKEAPVLKCEVFNSASRFCFLEFRTLPLTWYCLKLDGIAYNGYSLRVGRPHDYVPPVTGDPAINAIIPGFENSTFRDVKPATAPPRGEGLDQKLYIQNLPQDMTDDEVRTLLEQFGTLRVLNLIKDVSTGRNKGYGFFEYEDPTISELAIKTLNGLQCQSHILSVQMANFEGPGSGEKRHGSVMVTSLSSSITQKFLSHALISLQVEAARKVGGKPSKVVQLLNIVFLEDLLDDAEYADLVEDIKTEAEKYGPLKQIVIPRPSKDLSNLDGVGKVFLFFTDETASRKARMMMNGRKFDQKRVTCAAFYPEERFLEGKYTLQP